MKINKIDIFLFFLLIPLFEPKLFTQFNISAYIYILFNIIIFVYFIIKFIILNIPLSKCLIIWIIYRVYMLCVGLINLNIDGLMQWGYLSINVANFLLLFQLYSKKHFKTIVFNIALITTILLIANYFTLIIFPRGIIKSTFYDQSAGDYYLLGIRTQFTTMMFPAIAASFLYFKIAKTKKSMIIFAISTLSCLLNIFNKSISTAIVGLCLILLLILFSKMFKIKYNCCSCIVAGLIANILVVFFGIQSVFSNFIENVLHKDTSLSSRIYIWNSAKKLIYNENLLNLLFGNGLYRNDSFVPYSNSFWQPHNQLLAIIYQIGIIGGILLIAFLINLLKNYDYSYESQFILILCMVILILGITEVYLSVAVCYIPFILIFYFNKYKKTSY